MLKQAAKLHYSFLAQYMTQTDIVRVIFSSLLRHARLSTFLLGIPVELYSIWDGDA